MILDVPYQSQKSLENGQELKWCGIASLWMVLAYYLEERAPRVEELLQNYGEEFEKNGFLHQDLLQIARNYNLKGFRKSWWADPGTNSLIEKFKSEGESEDEIGAWMETNVLEGIFTIKNFINHDTPVIVSVSPEFSPSSHTHLVVVVGYEGNNLIIHDPYKKGANFKINQEDFKKLWIRQAIIITR